MHMPSKQGPNCHLPSKLIFLILLSSIITMSQWIILADLKECCHCTSSITRQVKSLSSVSKHGKDERNYNEHKTMLIDPQISHCDCCYQECSTMRSSCSYIFTNIIIISKHRKISSDSWDSIQMHNLLHAWKLTLQSWTMLILCIRTFVFLLPGLYSLIR